MPVLQLCVRLIHPDLDPRLPMWGDGQGAWQPDALAWLGTLAAAGVPFRAGPDASIDDGAGLLLVPDPNAVEIPVKQGRPVLLGPPPPTVAERLAAIRDALGAIVIPDFRRTLVLRVDDPGSSIKNHLEEWAHPGPGPGAWERLWGALRPTGRVSIFCCPGWVTEDGQVVDSRIASPQEWTALSAGVKRGRADLECHGFTHLDPDLEAWRAAPDRTTDVRWYRELWPPRMAGEPSIRVQAELLARWQAACPGGTTVVAPGEAWGLNTIAAARHRGFQLFNSWGVCRLQLPVPTWSDGIGSPYLDRADASWFATGLPVVGYWHDRDMALQGPEWAPTQLAAWHDCGASRFISFADLARAYATEIDAALVGGEVVIRRAPERWPLRTELSPA